MKLSIKTAMQQTLRTLQVKSLFASNIERSEETLKQTLESVVTAFEVSKNDRHLTEKVRCQQTFQASLMFKALKLIEAQIADRSINVVDIGDSSGTHIKSLEALAQDFGVQVNGLSVNLDPEAVAHIRSRGLKAEVCRAEEFHLLNEGIKADVFMLFEVLEHLFDSISFLRKMATQSECRYFIVSVPYVKSSRVGLHHLRQSLDANAYAESTHIRVMSGGLGFALSILGLEARAHGSLHAISAQGNTQPDEVCLEEVRL